jgi:hypothetical protein
MVDGTHRLYADLAQVVVGCHQMRALAAQRVEVEGQGGGEGFPFTGLHFGDAPFVEHDAADHLNVEVALPNRADGCFAHQRERFRQQFFELCPFGDLPLEFSGLRPDFFLGELLNGGFQRVNVVNRFAVLGKRAFNRIANDLLDQISKHTSLSC